MSTTRRWTAMVLAAVALTVTIVALVDPLEGGLALLAAVVLTVVVRLMSRVPIPRLELIGMIAAVTIGAAALTVFALVGGDGSGTARAENLGNPLGGGAIALVWVYRVAVVIAIAGAVQYLVRILQQARLAREVQR